MSRVFVAEEQALGRSIVIKVLRPDLASAVSIKRFEREIAFAARLQHAHIVPLHSAGACSGLPYFTMPFVVGDSLRVHLARHGEMPIADAVRVLREIASALAYAHDQGVVHRDIKPDNVLLSADSAMVTDFGVAKALERSVLGAQGTDIARGDPADTSFVSSLGIALGTPAYMAPEQVAGDAGIDHRADIYSFGALAYEMLVGQPPFGARSAQQLLAAHLGEAPEPVDRRRPSIPPALADLVMRCLEKRPADRPQRTADIVQLLGEMASAGSAGPDVRVSVPPRRGVRYTRRQLWLALAVIGALTSTAIVVIPPLVGPGRPSLAVLPFDNLGATADEYFADGVTDEVASRLTSLSGLDVIGRASAQQYKRSTKSPRQIARELGVKYLLTGTVRWERSTAGLSRVRVSPVLLRGDDGSSIWAAKPYEGPLSDVFAFQAAVAEGVTDAMNLTLGVRERRALTATPTTNLEAYDAFLRGLASSGRRQLFDARARAKTIAEFQRAVNLDSSFAAAHARLAEAYVNEERFGNSPTALDAAEPHLRSAVALDSTASETRLAQGWYYLERNALESAHDVVRALLRDAPGNSRALYLGGLVEEELNLPDEAIASYRRAQILDPTSPDPPAALAALYDALGRHDEAIRSRDQEITLSPENADAHYAQAASYLLWRYDTLRARLAIERGMASAGPTSMTRLPRSWVLDWIPVLPPGLIVTLDTISRAGAASTLPGPFFDAMKIRFHVLAGHPQKARAVAESVVQFLEPRASEGDSDVRLLLGAAYVVLGRLEDAQRESDAAFGQLSRIVAPRRRIPGVLTVAWIDVQCRRLDVALDRLESVTRSRSGFYTSAAIMHSDRLWAPLRSHRRFERVVAAMR
jgi:serine/threonine-protein kinase